MRIFLIIVSILVGINNGSERNCLYLTLDPEQKYEFLIPIRRTINVTIKSTDGIPFVAKIYKSSGYPLKYKTNLIKCIDKIDYIKIKNSGDQSNNIILEMNEMEKARQFSLSSIIAILTTIVVIICEKKSTTTKIMLFIFLLVQLYELPYNVKVSERVFKKLLF